MACAEDKGVPIHSKDQSNSMNPLHRKVTSNREIIREVENRPSGMTTNWPEVGGLSRHRLRPMKTKGY
jgi:hypothetical protein